MVEIVIKLLFGAIAGAAVGLFIARGGCCGATACDSENENKSKCSTRSPLRTIFSIIAGAVFGTAVTWYVINK